ncbi:MAG: zinc ribbon domain-containing protein [Patescibacteria group bacterium]
MWPFKKSQESENSTLKFQSDEHRVSIGTIVLTIVMVAFLMVVSERALSDLESSISRPVDSFPWNCLNGYSFSYYTDAYVDPYQYEPAKPVRTDAAGVPVDAHQLCKDIAALQTIYSDKGRTLRNPLQRQLDAVNAELGKERAVYDTSLLEDIADGENVNDSSANVRQKIIDLEKQKGNIEARIQAVYLGELVPVERQIDVMQKEAKKLSSWQAKIYETKIFGLLALFVIPFFLLGFFWYRRSHERNSRYSFIPLGVLITASILAIQIFARFTWSWLPRELFKEIWDFLAQNPITRIIGYYVVIVVIVAIFAGLIYLLQRHLFSFKRMATKRLSTRKCPYCAFPMQDGVTFCSGCGKELIGHCTSCGKDTLKFMAYCQECGAEQIIQR